MHNRKLNPLQAIAKLFQPSSHAQAFEQNLKNQIKAEAYYTNVPMPRF